MKLSGWCFFFISTLLSICDLQAGDKIKVDMNAEFYKSSFKKFIIYADINNVDYRKKIEFQFEKIINNIKQVTASSSISFFPPQKKWPIKQVQDRMKLQGYPCYVYIQLIPADSTDLTGEKGYTGMIVKLVNLFDSKVMWEARITPDSGLWKMADLMDKITEHATMAIDDLKEEKLIYDCGCGH